MEEESIYRFNQDYKNAPDYPEHGIRDVRDIEVKYETVTGE